ncbi:MAG: hypothetical protein JWQ71_4982 [Pedosphaera sp.]|nr:hypothetical protein [Pedosphaera sp.]
MVELLGNEVQSRDTGMLARLTLTHCNDDYSFLADFSNSLTKSANEIPRGVALLRALMTDRFGSTGLESAITRLARSFPRVRRYSLCTPNVPPQLRQNDRQ